MEVRRIDIRRFHCPNCACQLAGLVCRTVHKGRTACYGDIEARDSIWASRQLVISRAGALGGLSQRCVSLDRACADVLGPRHLQLAIRLKVVFAESSLCSRTLSLMRWPGIEILRSQIALYCIYLTFHPQVEALIRSSSR